MAIPTQSGLRRFLAQSAFVVLALSGCVSQPPKYEGQDLINQGQIEEGLAKMAAASRAAPGDIGLRTAYLSNREQASNRLLVAANGERQAGRYDAALTLYQEVLRIDPENNSAKRGIQLVSDNQRHDVAIAKAEEMLKAGDVNGANATLKPVFLEDPKNAKALALYQQIKDRKLKEREAEPVLGPQFNKPVTLQFRDANLKMVFEALSRTNGINILLDKDIRPDLKTTIFVKDASVEDTIDLILMQNQLRKKILSENTVFVYPDTPQKLKQYEDLKIRSFHLVHADPKQIMTMLKTLLKTNDIFVHAETNSVVMRGTPDAIRLAEKLVADQDVEPPEVMLELEVLEVTRTHLSELGIAWPDTLAVTTPDTVATVNDLKSLHGGDLLVSSLSATLKLHLDEGDTKVLAAPRIRVRNREKAKIMVGSRVPVITNSITPVSTGTPVVTGTVQYLDVGLKLEVEPDVQLDNQVVIKMGMDVSSIVKEVDNPQSGTVAYQIGTRNATTVLRLRDGETQILGGLIDDEDRKTSNEVPGLGKIPILSHLFGSHKDDKTKTEIVLAITPHLIGGSPPPDANGLEYWTGTENDLRNGPFSIGSHARIALSADASAAATPVGVPTVSDLPAWKAHLLQSGRNSLQAVTGGGPASVTGDKPMALSWQGPAQVKVGDTVNLTLNGESSQLVHGMRIAMSYDPSVFKVVDVLEGGFLKQNNLQTSFAKNVNPSGGQIQLAVSDAGKSGASGSGTIATVVLQALTENPHSQVLVSQAVPVGSAGEQLPVTMPDAFAISVEP